MRTLTEKEHEGLLAAKRERDELHALVNNPQTENFLQAVRAEAAHQILRWGRSHDRRKSAEAWYWLVGFLAGKCLRAWIDGDVHKAMHHTISAGAALLHMHAAIQSDASGRGVGADEDLQAIADQLFKAGGRKLRHVKTGHEVFELGVSQLKTAQPVDEGELVMVYLGSDGQLWTRPAAEFGDGRFVEINADGSCPHEHTGPCATGCAGACNLAVAAAEVAP
jgi:hypothetical protein